MEIDLKHTIASFAVNNDGCIAGLGGLRINDIDQMNRDYPATFVFQSPTGFDYRQFKPIETVKQDDTIILRTEAVGTALDHSWYRDQYDHDILQVGRPKTPPALKVDFILTPLEIEFEQVHFKGIRLSWQIHSKAANLGRLRWMQHWEVNGSCEGTTIYWQSQIAPPVATFSRESAWDNICWKTLAKAKTDCNISMQMNARAAYHQLFDFLCSPQGIFLAYYPQPQTIQTICRKNPGETEYHIAESIEFPLMNNGSIPGKNILFATESGATEASRRNLWFSINEYLENSYREQTGIVKSRMLPTRTHFMWGAVPDKNHVYYDPYNRGDKIPAESYLEWLAENEMPQAVARGFKRFWTRPYCVSDASELMFYNKSMQGRSIMDGDVTIGSCCCVHEYKPSVMYGGGKMAKRFYDLGHQQGLEIGIWVGNHLSTRAPIFKDHPDWILKDRNFANPAGGYDDLIMAVINWNSGARDWILQDLLAWKENYGLDFIFFDSLGNLGLKTRNFTRADLADNFAGLVKFASDLTQAGIEIICEGRSFIGAPHFGISYDGNIESEADPLRGQNSISWYLGNEDMFCGIEAFTSKPKKAYPPHIEEMHFKILAGGGLIDFCNSSTIMHEHLHIYNRVAALMKKRIILEENRGVLWLDNSGNAVLFSFESGEIKLPLSGKIEKITAEGPTPVGNGNVIKTEKMCVYSIKSTP